LGYASFTPPRGDTRARIAPVLLSIIYGKGRTSDRNADGTTANSLRKALEVELVLTLGGG
jgi:hypothetical protein